MQAGIDALVGLRNALMADAYVDIQFSLPKYKQLNFYSTVQQEEGETPRNTMYATL